MDELKLADVEIHYHIDGGVSKVFIDGIDYSNKVRKLETSVDVENMIPIVKLELYSDNLIIKGKAKADIKCEQE